VTAAHVVVVGAGMGGLAAAADLARAGCRVTVLERAAGPGGKMRQVSVEGQGIDAGPTVFTMRWVFEALFADAGRRLEDSGLDLVPANVLARHAWRPASGGGRLDLFADVARSVEAIGDFAGAAEARGYRDFVARAADMHATLCAPFMAAQRPSPVELVRRLGPAGLPGLWRTAPMRTLWGALGAHFRDPRLRQLFARYATYVGSSPFQAPATLMLIAHVEQDGVWMVRRGGMRRVAEAIRDLGAAQGAAFRFGAEVEEVLVEGGRAAGVRLADGERIAARAVVFNGDASALGQGLLGAGARRAAAAVPAARRSLSAVVWCARAAAAGFPLSFHNVFFGDDYRDEFAAVFRRRDVTAHPTVYLCAQDRVEGEPEPVGPERMLLLVNAPADGDTRDFAPALPGLEARMRGLLGDCGLELEWRAEAVVPTAPDGFHRLFPATGGALYGRANHGAMGSFARPGAASRLPGLYLAGGSAHPGAGIPMATLSGRLAAARLLEDLAGTAPARRRWGLAVTQPRAQAAGAGSS
jgi:1-hydroxycarotenoid 3,4-desaturase